MMDTAKKQHFLCLALQSLLEYSLDMIFIKDVDLVYIAASDSFAHMVHLEKGSDIVGKSDFDVFSEALAQKYTVDDRMILASGNSIMDYIEPLPDQRGKKSYSSTSKFLVRDENGAVLGLCGVARDVTAQVELEAEREAGRLSRQMFDDVLEADLSEDRMLRMEGSKWVKALGVAESSSFTDMAGTLAQRNVHPEYMQEFLNYYNRDALKERFKKGILEFTHVTYMKGEHSDYHWMECRSRVYHSRVSDTLRVTTFLKDIDMEVRSKQLLQHKAATDELTGLYNRASVMEQIAACLSGRAVGRTHALLFIDLDHFKEVNDTWGHRFGDKVLQKVAERLRQIFGEEDILGRVGGDEFMVFLRNAPTCESVVKKAQRVAEMLPFYHYDKECEVWVTCSVGVVLCGTEEDVTVENLYERADKAMYRAKENGRSQVFLCEDITR